MATPANADFRFRAATADDALCLGALSTQVFFDTYATDGIRPDLAREASAVHSAEVFDDRLRDPTRRFVVVESPGGLVGFVEMAMASACPVAAFDGPEVVRLYVHRSVHRRGLGRALGARARRLAAEADRAFVWLAAWAGNTVARTFYTASGWKDVGTTSYPIEGRAYENRVFVIPSQLGTE